MDSAFNVLKSRELAGPAMHHHERTTVEQLQFKTFLGRCSGAKPSPGTNVSLDKILTGGVVDKSIRAKLHVIQLSSTHEWLYIHIKRTIRELSGLSGKDDFTRGRSVVSALESSSRRHPPQAVQCSRSAAEPPLYYRRWSSGAAPSILPAYRAHTRWQGA